MEGTLVKIRADVVTEGALVITCFPSVGMVSSVVGHYLIDNLQLEFVGGVVDPRLPPLTLVTDGKPMPIIRAYAGKPECSIEGCDKIILLMSELVIPSPLVHDIVWALYDWSKGSKIRMGILVDAFSKDGLGGNSGIEEPTVEYADTEDTDLVGIGATDHVCGMLKDMDIPMLTSGVIRGMNGVLLSEARRRAIDVMSVMVEADPRFPDARAAAALVKKLNAILPTTHLDDQPLLEEAQLLEDQLKSLLSQAAPSAAPSPSSMLYG